MGHNHTATGFTGRINPQIGDASLQSAGHRTGDSDIQSILEMLWNTYCQHNQLDSVQIKDGFTELYRHMKDIPIPDMNGVIDIVCSLCWDHEKTGFVEGVKVGIRLEQELTD